MREFIYQVRKFGYRIATANWMIEKGADMLEAKSIHLEFYDDED